MTLSLLMYYGSTNYNYVIFPQFGRKYVEHNHAMIPLNSLLHYYRIDSNLYKFSRRYFLL